MVIIKTSGRQRHQAAKMYWPYPFSGCQPLITELGKFLGDSEEEGRETCRHRSSSGKRLANWDNQQGHTAPDLRFKSVQRGPLSQNTQTPGFCEGTVLCSQDPQ